MNGLKKAALFLSGLKYSAVDQLLSRLDFESARAVRREMMSLQHDAVTVQESEKLDTEFLQTAGIPVRKSVQEHLFTGSTTYSAPKRPRKPMQYEAEAFVPQSRPFDFLRDWNTETIVSEIIEEHPQTIALILAHLPRSRSKEVLSALPENLQRELNRRLAEYEEPDVQVLLEIESTLKKRQSRNGNVVNSFDDLDRLSNAELSRLFHSVDSTTAMISLIGANPPLIERVTKRFTPMEEYQMRQKLKQLGNVSEDDVLQARKNLLKKWRIEN
jgi:flagellar motor switch protein FliG